MNPVVQARVEYEPVEGGLLDFLRKQHKMGLREEKGALFKSKTGAIYEVMENGEWRRRRDYEAAIAAGHPAAPTQEYKP